MSTGKCSRERLYSIGEASEICGVSVQTLRYYDKIGLISPIFVDKTTRYRYYSYDQISILDRIRYLQSFGLSLAEIRESLESKSGKALLPYLRCQLDRISSQIESLNELHDVLEWYIKFFDYPDHQNLAAVPYKKTFPTRYALMAENRFYGYPDKNDISIPETAINLRRIKANSKLPEKCFLRQNGFIINYESMMNRILDFQSYFVYCKKKPDVENLSIIAIPGGEYVCFQGRLLNDDWDTTYCAMIMKALSSASPPTFAVADEYEGDLSDFKNSLYEIQVPVHLLDQPD